MCIRRTGNVPGVYTRLVAYPVRVGGWDDSVVETLALVAHQQMSVVVCCFLRERDRVVERGGAQGLHCLQFPFSK